MLVNLVEQRLVNHGQVIMRGLMLPWFVQHELEIYLRAVVALLRGEPVPPVPAAYAAHLAAIQAAE